MKSRFEFIKTSIDGFLQIQRGVIIDDRGSFARMFCVDEFQKAGFLETIRQINRTVTINKGAIRGMHLQVSPNEDYKIISCLSGKVFDVAVDLRKESPTFLQWQGVVLDSDHVNGVLIPPGIAHGFQTLEDNCEMLYFHSAFYSPESEVSINFLDLKVGIEWPLQENGISKKDKNSGMLNETFKGF